MSETPKDTGNVRPLATGLALLAGLARLMPLPSNFAPIGALGIFGGARLRTWQAYLLPLAVMAGSDLLLWVIRDYPPFDPFVYFSFAIYVLIGRALVRTRSTWKIGAATLLGSVQFFLITNLGDWLDRVHPMYPPTFAGLLECYAAALPFFRNTVLGDLFFTALFFALHAGLSRVAFPGERVPQVRPTP